MRGQIPHSATAERAILASILLSPELLVAVSEKLETEDFYFERHRRVYIAMLEIRKRDRGIDLLTLQAELEDAGVFSETGGMAFLAGLDLDLPDLQGVESYVEIVRDRAVRRRLMNGCLEIASSCAEGSGADGQSVLVEAERLIFGLAQSRRRGGFQMLDQAFEEATEQLRRRSSGLLGTATGFAEVDRLTEGLVAGSLLVLAGRPGLGKTAFALNVAQHVAIRERRPVAFFSLEMSVQELALRILASESETALSELRANRLEEAQWTRVYEAMERSVHAPLLIDDAPARNVREIASSARRLKSERGLALVVVDYLQLMEGGGDYESRHLEIGAISRALKILAKELGIPVLALSQLSRRAEQREDRRPRLSDLRESGSIEQDADLVLFLHEERGRRELIVEKHRNGPTGSVAVTFSAETVTFRCVGARS